MYLKHQNGTFKRFLKNHVTWWKTGVVAAEFSLFTGINYMMKYKNENRKGLFFIVLIFHIIAILLYFSHKCSLCEHKRCLSKTYKSTNPKLFNSTVLNYIYLQMVYFLVINININWDILPGKQNKMLIKIVLRCRRIKKRKRKLKIDKEREMKVWSLN